MKKLALNIIKFIIIMLFTCLSGCFIYYIDELNILNQLYYLIFIIVIIIFWFFIVYNFTSKKTKPITLITLIIITLLISSLYFIGFRYASETVKFVSKITESNYINKKYFILVLKNSEFNEINDLNNKNIGFISNDNVDLIKKNIKDKIKYNDKKYDNVGILISKIYSKEIDALVIDESYIDLFEENNVSFKDESKEIYTFNIKVKKDNVSKKVDVNKTPFLVYISGSDSRTGINTVARSDVNIVAVINPNTNKILLISIPRDYYVQLHNTTGTKDKLTHAGIYGIEMSKTTIEDLLDISINYYIKVSFASVINAVDVIDGIDIESDTEFTAKAQNGKTCNYVKGINHLDGDCALRYARERKIYLSGDRHRGQNQQAVITAMINKLNNPKYLVKYDEILTAIDGSFVTDMSYKEITDLAKNELTSLKKWSVESISLDGTGSSMPTYSMGSLNLYVMIPDDNTIINAKEKIKEYIGG